MNAKPRPELGKHIESNDYTREEVEEKIARGLAQAERGEAIDGDEAFRRLRAQSAERRGQRA